MSPAVKQRLTKALSNSNPNLAPALDRSNKPASGSAMLHAGDVYQRKQIMDSADDIDNVRRKRSNSADSSTSRMEPEAEPDITSPCKCTTGQSTQGAQLGKNKYRSGFNQNLNLYTGWFENSSSFVKRAVQIEPRFIQFQRFGGFWVTAPSSNVGQRYSATQIEKFWSPAGFEFPVQ